MILEAIVTTGNASGDVNIAPMGPLVEPPDWTRFTLRPFNTSTTYRNLIDTGRAVIHVTDDVRLFARAAVGHVASQGIVAPVDHARWWRLRDCHRWFAVEVTDVVDTDPRAEMRCRVVHERVVRPFFGFNRAKHAVIEAAILATRTHLLDADKIDQELARLEPLIDKTAGPDEADAFETLRRAIHKGRIS